MDKMREEFERWAESENMCRKHLHNIGWTTYMDAGTDLSWKAWQDSRARVVVSLPDWSEYDTPRQVIDAVRDRLESAGIKWTE